MLLSSSSCNDKFLILYCPLWILVHGIFLFLHLVPPGALPDPTDTMLSRGQISRLLASISREPAQDPARSKYAVGRGGGTKDVKAPMKHFLPSSRGERPLAGGCIYIYIYMQPYIYVFICSHIYIYHVALPQIPKIKRISYLFHLEIAGLYFRIGPFLLGLYSLHSHCCPHRTIHRVDITIRVEAGGLAQCC